MVERGQAVNESTTRPSPQPVCQHGVPRVRCRTIRRKKRSPANRPILTYLPQRDVQEGPRGSPSPASPRACLARADGHVITTSCILAAAQRRRVSDIQNQGPPSDRERRSLIARLRSTRDGQGLETDKHRVRSLPQRRPDCAQEAALALRLKTPCCSGGRSTGSPVTTKSQSGDYWVVRLGPAARSASLASPLTGRAILSGGLGPAHHARL